MLGVAGILTQALVYQLITDNNRSMRMSRAVLPGPVLLPPELTEEEKEQSVAGTLVNREGEPAHVAMAVLHFIENDFVTGTCLPVDGGRTIWAPEA